MVELLPYLIKKAPDGSEEKIILHKTKITFGRYSNNDIPLAENETNFCSISRQHCVLELSFGEEWVLTDTSTNGTFLEREGQQIKVSTFPKQQVTIANGDRILIHEYVLTFYDLNRTDRSIELSSSQKASQLPSSPLLDTTFVFNLSQITLYKIVAGKRESIDLYPQLCQMLSFMAKKNLDNNNQPILCTYEELRKEIWGNKYHTYGNNHLTDLAKHIRNKFEKYKGSRSLLETKTKRGFILHITCEP